MFPTRIILEKSVKCVQQSRHRLLLMCQHDRTRPGHGKKGRRLNKEKVDTAITEQLNGDITETQVSGILKNFTENF